MTTQGKILTGLMERRAIEAAFDALAQAADPPEMIRCAQAVADFGGAAVPVLLARLNTEDPKVRGGLGLVAQRLDRTQVALALKTAIRARDRSDQARVTALTLLERFLHEPADAGLLGAIQNPAGIARQSLRELIAAMEDDPAAIVEYLTQLAEQPADTPELLMQVMPELLPHPHLITLLRMFAQGEDARLAQQAIELLGRTRTPEALLALISLTVGVAPERTSAAERGMRKLRLSGVQAAPALVASDWQALLSPVDGVGIQLVWLICRPPDGTAATALSLILRDPDGVLATAQVAGPGGDEIPPSGPPGEILAVAQPDRLRPLMLLSASFEMGRRAIYEAAQLHWANGHLPPLTYRLFSHQFWQYGPLAPDAEAEPVAAVRDGLTATLLDHPAFAGWFWQAPALLEMAERLGARYSIAQRAAAVHDLARTAFSAADVASYGRRLRAMARWLQAARQPDAAELAAAAAAQLATRPAEEILLVRRLIGIGLDVAAINLRSGYDRRRAA